MLKFPLFKRPDLRGGRRRGEGERKEEREKRDKEKEEKGKEDNLQINVDMTEALKSPIRQ